MREPKGESWGGGCGELEAADHVAMIRTAKVEKVKKLTDPCVMHGKEDNKPLLWPENREVFPGLHQRKIDGDRAQVPTKCIYLYSI